jgi:hypothetical protein
MGYDMTGYSLSYLEGLRKTMAMFPVWLTGGGTTKRTDKQGSCHLRLQMGVTSDKVLALILLTVFLFLALSANAIGRDSQQQVSTRDDATRNVSTQGSVSW